MEILLNDSIEKVKTLKLQSIRRRTMDMFFQKQNYKLSKLRENIVRFLSMMTFALENQNLNLMYMSL